MSNGSLLDKVLESRQRENIGKFHPYQLLDDLFCVLAEREQKVLCRRFQLLPNIHREKETLETIGKELHITRERVRQIENEAIHKLQLLKEKSEKNSPLQILSDVVGNILSHHGGIMEERHLIFHLNQISLHQESADSVLHFFLHYLLNKHFDHIPETDTLYRGWKLPLASFTFLEMAHAYIHRLIEEAKHPFELEELLKILQQELEEKEISHNLTTDILLALLRLNKQLHSNVFHQWGLAHWPQIHPRHMNDKIYIVLKREGVPLHFRDIALRINSANFDKKQAYPATIHNELILDAQYVLVGKGIYALREWGYEKGTVADVITSILREENFVSREKIIEKVLAKRFVKRTTILLALMDKNQFSRNEKGEYYLKSHDHTDHHSST